MAGASRGTIATRTVYVDGMGEDRGGERADSGFEIAPTRIGGSGGPRPARRRRAPVAIVIAIALLVPTVAWIGPRIEWRPEIDISFLRPTPTPLPSKTPRPVFTSEALPTSLPAITIGVGPHPTDPFPVDVNGLRLADPATGALSEPFGMRGDTDAVFTSASGGWWCVCFVRAAEGDHENATVEIRRVDATGRMTQHRIVGEYRSVAPPPFQDYYNRFDLEVSPDQQTAYLASATRAGDQWAVAVDAIDLSTLMVTGHSDLGSLTIPPLPTPTLSPDQGMIENYFAGPVMRLSPDGRQLIIWSWVDTSAQAGPTVVGDPQGWSIDIEPGATNGSIGRLTSIGPSLSTNLRTCYWVAWTTADELDAICWPADGSTGIMTLAALRPDGTELRHSDLFDASNSWLTDPLLDRANRLVYLWQPADHVLWRVGLDQGKVEELKVDPNATGGGPSGTGSGSGNAGSSRRPDWMPFTSDMRRMYYAPQLLAEPGGSRLYALGMLSDETRSYSPGSSGIWVFDAEKLSLLERWAPLAAYGSIGLSGDGRWLSAVGAPGVNEEGQPTNWESSITVYDVSDGHPALQLGRLGADVQALQVPP